MNIDRLAEEYVKQTAHIKSATARKEELKKMLMGYIEEKGTPDSSGHFWLAGEEYLLKRERRVTRGWDAAAAEAWATEAGILDEVTTTITPPAYTIVDPDKVAAYAFLHPEVESIVKKFNTEDETWAFPQPVPQKKYNY